MVAQHRNRNLIGTNSINQPKQFMEPAPTLSVGLNSNFTKNIQMTSIQYNPMNELEDDKQNKTAKKTESNNQLLSDSNRLPRDGSNS